jgi:hypothetical protein
MDAIFGSQVTSAAAVGEFGSAIAAAGALGTALPVAAALIIDEHVFCMEGGWQGRHSYHYPLLSTVPIDSFIRSKSWELLVER